MSSLLQHHGGRSSDRRKVELYAIRTVPSPEPHLADSPVCGDPAETFIGDNGKRYPVLYRFYRRPAGMFGCWVQFRYCGGIHVPDLSVPISLFELPRDAERVPDDQAYLYWTS